MKLRKILAIVVAVAMFAGFATVASAAEVAIKGTGAFTATLEGTTSFGLNVTAAYTGELNIKIGTEGYNSLGDSEIGVVGTDILRISDVRINGRRVGLGAGPAFTQSADVLASTLNSTGLEIVGIKFGLVARQWETWSATNQAILPLGTTAEFKITANIQVVTDGSVNNAKTEKMKGSTGKGINSRVLVDTNVGLKLGDESLTDAGGVWSSPFGLNVAGDPTQGSAGAIAGAVHNGSANLAFPNFGAAEKAAIYNAGGATLTVTFTKAIVADLPTPNYLRFSTAGDTADASKYTVNTLAKGATTWSVNLPADLFAGPDAFNNMGVKDVNIRLLTALTDEVAVSSIVLAWGAGTGADDDEDDEDDEEGEEDDEEGDDEDEVDGADVCPECGDEDCWGDCVCPVCDNWIEDCVCDFDGDDGDDFGGGGGNQGGGSGDGDGSDDDDDANNPKAGVALAIVPALAAAAAAVVTRKRK